MMIYSNKKINPIILKLLSILLLIGLFVDSAHAAEKANVVNEQFLDTLSQFVNDILHNSNIRKFVDQMMIAFVFFMIIWEICYFLIKGLDFERLFNKAAWCIFAFVLLQLYDPITSAIWGMSEGLAGDIQYTIVGNRDPYFLPTWVFKMFNLLQTENGSLWDSIKILGIIIVWMLVTSILTLILYISSFFAVFGYALAKIVGIFFIPLIIFEGTRNYFDGWVRFFIGFVILAVVLRVNAIIIALLVKAQCLSLIGNSVGFNLPTQPIFIKFDGNQLLMDLIFSGIVGIIFVISSFSFATALASGAGSACGSIGKGINGVAKFAAKFI